MFCCALRIEKVVPTVNVGSAASRAKMKTWVDRECSLFVSFSCYCCCCCLCFWGFVVRLVWEGLRMLCCVERYESLAD